MIEGARGERSGPARRVGPLVIVAVVLVGLAIAATVALLPHRAERALPGTRLRAVRVWNAFESRCQLENGRVEPRVYTCGSYARPDVHRATDASARLQAIMSEHDNCVIDDDTLEAYACTDSLYEWVMVGREVVSVAALHPSGRYSVITQQHLVTREIRTIDVPFTQWFDRSDPREVLVVEGDRDRVFRVRFGVLEPFEEDHGESR